MTTTTNKDVFEEIQQEVSKGKDATKALASRSSTQISMAQNYAIEAEDDQQSMVQVKEQLEKDTQHLQQVI